MGGQRSAVRGGRHVREHWPRRRLFPLLLPTGAGDPPEPRHRRHLGQLLRDWVREQGNHGGAARGIPRDLAALRPQSHFQGTVVPAPAHRVAVELSARPRWKETGREQGAAPALLAERRLARPRRRNPFHGDHHRHLERRLRRPAPHVRRDEKNRACITPARHAVSRYDFRSRPAGTACAFTAAVFPAPRAVECRHASRRRQQLRLP
mmetsp:Transcript_27813/g.81742  ORF Transcript_27813/g.81742 Transcript_27813/m.81742 type:complete len:207 (-) Transcript_27813:501-1121(-)